MDTGIKITSEISKETSDNLRELICGIFKSASENRMDQSTVVNALMVVKETIKIEHIAITGCTISHDKHVHMDKE